MFNFKKFPILELLSKIFAISILMLSFKIITLKIGSKNNLLVAKTNQQNKCENTTNTTPIPINEKLILLKKKLQLIEKLDAHIEEQAFLLSQTSATDSNHKKLIEKIESNLHNIQEEAKNKNISNLIDQPQIKELKNKINTYKQAIKN